MQLNEARELVDQLLEKHGLALIYSFGWINTAGKFGMCDRKAKIIWLSKKFVELNDYERVKLTILHEIAHALTKGGHTPDWKRKFLEIGGNGKKATFAEVAYNYVAVCPACGKEAKRIRKPRAEVSCGKCDKYFNKDKILNFKKV